VASIFKQRSQSQVVNVQSVKALVLRFQSGEVVVRLDVAKSPITATRLLSMLPVSTPFTRIGSLITIPLDLGSLPETFEVKVRRGELCYRPNTKQLILATEDVQIGSRINPLGMVVSNIDLLDSVKPGIVTIMPVSAEGKQKPS
jgi:hypothetical protein